MLNNIHSIKITLLWLLMAAGYMVHSLYDLGNLFFGMDITLPKSTGVVSNATHIFRIVVVIFAFVFGIIALYVRKKNFVWISFSWALLLGALNLFHVAETIIKKGSNYSQIALLVLILIVNTFLLWELWYWLQHRIKTRNTI